MTEPAPSTPTAPTSPIATACPPSSGTFAGRVPQADPPMLRLDIPHTDYVLHLVLDGDLPTNPQPGDKLTGTLHAEALRVDTITAGGRYVEPGVGRPRRVQGTIVGGNPSENTLFVKAGAATLACSLTDNRQSVADFHLHDMVSFDVKRGASFRPI
ncbi:MAG: hypothetical protein AAF328_09135 [Planctomycetota bacterium]